MFINCAVSEFIGTFCLVFVGTGAIVINDVSNGEIGHVGIAFAFGLVVMAMIYAVGDLSGAHINPAVTVAFCLARRFPWREMPIYVASQVLGAVAASGCLRLFFPRHEGLGTTTPSVPKPTAFAFEIILTFMLMFVIIHVAVGAKEKGLLAGVAIGGTVCFEALFAGPATGASMNPARSLGPALVSGQTDGLWIYVAAPLVGAALSILLCRLMRYDGCCAGGLESASGAIEDDV